MSGVLLGVYRHKGEKRTSLNVVTFISDVSLVFLLNGYVRGYYNLFSAYAISIM